MTDADAIFSRFSYVNPKTYRELLGENQSELERYLRDLQRHTPRDLECLFVQMSVERVKNEVRSAWQEMEEEQGLMDRYGQGQTGFYQHLPDHLFAMNTHSTTDITLEGLSIDDTTSVIARKESLGSESEGRCRGESFGSDLDHQRPRGTSLGSEVEVDSSARLGRPNRSFSIESADRGNGKGKGRGKTQQREKKLPSPPASLYLEELASQFYQSADGQLCFLSKFNMNCLTAEFSSNVPAETIQADTTFNQLRRRHPLPDFLEGNVLEIESLHLTPEMRKRMPVLSHLPYYTDILFVELDLNRILSNETKNKFKGELEKRKRRRKNKVIAEKRVDREQERREQQRIDELKSQMQHIDATDEFFQYYQDYEPDPEPGAMVGEHFGPSVGGADAGSGFQQPRGDPALSFRAVVHTPSTIAMTEDAFPTLGGGGSFPSMGAHATPSPVVAQPSWARGWHETNATPKAVEGVPAAAQNAGPRRGKKSKKKEKVLLFSTGGQRGGL